MAYPGYGGGGAPQGYGAPPAQQGFGAPPGGPRPPATYGAPPGAARPPATTAYGAPGAPGFAPRGPGAPASYTPGMSVGGPGATARPMGPGAPAGYPGPGAAPGMSGPATAGPRPGMTLGGPGATARPIGGMPGAAPGSAAPGFGGGPPGARPGGPGAPGARPFGAPATAGAPGAYSAGPPAPPASAPTAAFAGMSLGPGGTARPAAPPATSAAPGVFPRGPATSTAGPPGGPRPFGAGPPGAFGRGPPGVSSGPPATSGPPMGGAPPMGPGGPAGGPPMTAGPPMAGGGPPSGQGPPMSSGPPTGIGSGPPTGFGPSSGTSPQRSASSAAPAMYNPAALDSAPPSSGGAGAGTTPSAVPSGVPESFAGGRGWNNPGGAPASYGGGPAVTSAEVDASLLCDAAFMQATVGAMGSTQSTTQKAGLPFGLTLHPLAERTGVDPLPVVNFGAAGVVRCKTCRAYVNPFARFTDGGRRWQCPVCSRPNDVPSAYFAPLDEKGVRTDVNERPELSRGSVEFIAPSEYMVRPPQAPVYMFVIDVSYNAVASGMLANAVAAIKHSLDRLPGDSRTQIGFITFDSTIHFYNLKSTLSAPQMLVVSDIAEVFLPVPDDLLVNLSDSRTVVDALLDSLPDMFAGTSTVEAALGPSLLAAHAVMKHIGGKMLVFQASLPSLGHGKLRHRENTKLLGTDSEHTMLNAEEQFYKNQAIEFSKVQISCDLFLFSPTYTDVATLSDLSRLTAGHVYHYPAFHAGRDGPRFRADLSHDLERTTGWEAVMRVRCSRGVRVTNFHGNFYMRSQDLLALPNVTSDTACTVDLEYVDALQPGTVVVIQAALLYTSSSGERRICVHTTAVPVTTVVEEIYKNVDVEAVTSLVMARALESAKRTGLMAARQMLHRKCVDVMRCFRAAQSSGFGAKVQTSGMPLPENLQLLPLYMMALQKSILFRGGQDVGTDERSFLMYQAAGMSVARAATYVYPRMFSIHDMPDACGRSHPEGAPLVNDDGSSISVAGERRIRLPGPHSLSSERLNAGGVFLLDDGVEMLLWVGRAAPPGLLEALFGFSTFEGVDMAAFVPAKRDNEFSSRVWEIIGALREGKPLQQRLLIVREGAGDFAERRFHWRLVEDRQGFAGAGVTYADYLASASRESLQSAAVSGGTGGAR